VDTETLVPPVITYNVSNGLLFIRLGGFTLIEQLSLVDGAQLPRGMILAKTIG
jgi:hypothetical protein